MMYEKFRQYKNYAIIGIVSLICLFFLPFTGSTVGLQFVLPDTVAGWIVFVVNKILVASVNILILYCFVNQGKFNVRNDPKYIEARNLLLQEKFEEVIPKSPREHLRDIYGKKGTTLFLTSILATISLTQAVLSFDLITMITYTITIITGIIFGVIQMGEEEVWWTEDYWRYAQYIKSQNEKEEIE